MILKRIFLCSIAFVSIQSLASPVAWTDSSRKDIPVWVSKKGPNRPTRTLQNDIIHTKLNLRFDWLRQQAIGSAKITFKPYFYTQNTLELDAKGFDIKGVFRLDTLNQYDSTQQKYAQKIVFDTLQYTYNRKTLTIHLGRAYSRFDTAHVLIDYVAKPNEIPTELLGSKKDKGLYFINADGLDKDKPQQIWTQGETENNSCWFPTVDSPNEKMTQDISLTVEDKYKTLSNGRLVSSVNNNDSTRTDRWVQTLPHAPYLAMFVVGDFAVVKDTLPSGLELSYYVEPNYKTYTQAIFGRTKDMISFFEKCYGLQYPWDKYAQIAVRDFTAGAMENTSATVHAESVQASSRELLDGDSDDVIAHELTHHWFGDLVTCENWGQLPLNEAFANFSEYLWLEHQKGKDAAGIWAQGELQQYLAESETKQEPLIRQFYKEQEDMFDSHSYSKGGLVMLMLRKYVGDDAFFLSLKKYLEQNRFKTAEVSQLRTAFEEVTGEDLNWFFNQWFLSAGHPSIKIEKKYEAGRTTFKVMQQQDSTYTPIYKLPLKIDVWANGQKQRHEVTLTRAIESFEFITEGKPDLIDFDVEKQLLADISYEKTKPELLFQFNHCDTYLARYEAVTGLENFVRDSTIRQMMLMALSDPFWKIRQLAVSNFAEYDGDGFSEVEQLLQSRVRVDDNSRVRTEAIITLNSLGDKANDPLYREALDDSSYLVVSAAIDAYLLSKPDDAADIASHFENAPNSQIVTAVANYYAGLAQPERYDWFMTKMAKLKPMEMYNYLQVFGKYLIKSEEDIQRRALPYLETTARSNSSYFVRFGAFQVLGLLTDITGVKAMRKDIRASETDPKLKEMYRQFGDY